MALKLRARIDPSDAAFAIEIASAALRPVPIWPAGKPSPVAAVRAHEVALDAELEWLDEITDDVDALVGVELDVLEFKDSGLVGYELFATFEEVFSTSSASRAGAALVQLMRVAQGLEYFVVEMALDGLPVTPATAGRAVREEARRRGIAIVARIDDVSARFGAAEAYFLEATGASWPCSPAELKAHFRRLALATHPDQRPNDAEATRRFQLLKEGYDALTSRLA